MSSTNKTTYYELPQFVDNDIFNPLVDDNDAYSKIDTALHNIANAAANNASEIVGVKSRLDGAEGDIDALEAQNGNSVLTTTAQTLSGAVNELDADTSALDGRVDIVEDDINNASTGLKTKVTALEAETGALDGRLDTVEDDINNASTGLKAKVTALEAQNGDETLVTTAQTLSGAVNEVNSEVDTVTNRVTVVENDLNNASTGLKVKVNANTSDINSLSADLLTETSNRQNTDNTLQAQINQIVAPSGEAPSVAEVENARVGADGVTYPSLGDAIRTQFDNLEGNIDNLAHFNVVGKNLYNKNSADQVNGMYVNATTGVALESATFTTALIDIVGGSKISTSGSLLGGSHVSFYSSKIETSDLVDHTYVPNWISGTTGALTGFTVPANAVQMSISLPTTVKDNLQVEYGNEATPYSPYTFYAAQLLDSVKYDRMSRLEDKVNLISPAVVTVGASGADYTTIISALKNTPLTTKILVKAGTYNIWDEYISEYGATFWDDYAGYSGSSDKFMSGLWLGNGREIEFDNLAYVVFEPSDAVASENVKDYFSVFSMTANNKITNLNLKFKNCRYAIHDDGAGLGDKGTTIYSKCTFDGVSYVGATIGAGCGYDNIYIIEDCIFLNNISTYYDINYHNNNASGITSGKNKIIVKNCYGEGRVKFKWCGSFTDITECIVNNCEFNNIEIVPHETAPATIENMVLYAFNNTTHTV